MHCFTKLSVACVLAVNFEVYTLSNSDNVCDECCVLAYAPDTHLWRLFVVFSVMNSQNVSFRIPPKFIVDLPQSVLECVFNAQRLQRSCVRYVQETLITFPLILFALCSLCMRMIRFEYLRHAGCIFMAHLLSRQAVSFPVKPLDLMQLSN